MASTDVIIPRELTGDGEEGVVLSWLYDEGAQVDEGDVLVELTFAKVQYEVEAPCSGYLRRLVEEDEIVSAGTLLATIEP